MTKLRRRRELEAAAAARRLTMVARGPAHAGAAGGRGFEWFADPDGGPGADPDGPDADWDGGPDTDPPGVRRGGGPGPGRGPSPAAPPVGGRWREFAADRVPVALRGAAGVPVMAAVAVLIVVVAVVGGVLLRARASQPEVVDLAPARSVARAAGVGPTGQPGAFPTVPVGSRGAATAPLSAGPSSAAATASVTAAVSAAVVVDVVGRVRRPGLVRLPPGSRVADAVAAAGGPTDAAALARINLARVLADGEQVVVPDADDPLPAPPAPVGPMTGAGSGTAGAARPAGPLDLNSATAADLDDLPGVGPVLAGRIVEWRAQHQRFSRVDELAEVAGIGDKLLERLRPLVTV